MSAPSRCLNASLMLSRYRTTLVMSISTEVQAWGEVRTLRTMCSAMARRIGVSPRTWSPMAIDGKGMEVIGAAMGIGAGAAGAGIGVGAAGAGAVGTAVAAGAGGAACRWATNWRR